MLKLDIPLLRTELPSGKTDERKVTHLLDFISPKLPIVPSSLSHKAHGQITTGMFRIC